eukprot:1158871-Pelagomonas_calceolata.AAC.2
MQHTRMLASCFNLTMPSCLHPTATWPCRIACTSLQREVPESWPCQNESTMLQLAHAKGPRPWNSTVQCAACQYDTSL